MTDQAIEIGVKTVFHPSDFTEGDEAAWIHALKIALLAQGKLSLLHVNEEDEVMNWQDFPHLKPTLKRWGVIEDETSNRELCKTKLDVLKVACDSNNPVKGITKYLYKHPQDLVVLSTHQRKGMLRWLKDSVSEPLLEATSAMGLVVPRRVMGFVSIATGELRLKNILLPVENTGSAKQAFEGVLLLLAALGNPPVNVTLLHVGETHDFPSIHLDDVYEGMNVKRVVTNGPIVDGILSIAEEKNADLLVMTTHGKKGLWDSLMGSNTERVIRETACPVLVISQ